MFNCSHRGRLNVIAPEGRLIAPPQPEIRTMLKASECFVSLLQRALARAYLDVIRQSNLFTDHGTLVRVSLEAFNI